MAEVQASCKGSNCLPAPSWNETQLRHILYYPLLCATVRHDTLVLVAEDLTHRTIAAGYFRALSWIFSCTAADRSILQQSAMTSNSATTVPSSFSTTFLSALT